MIASKVTMSDLAEAAGNVWSTESSVGGGIIAMDQSWLTGYL